MKIDMFYDIMFYWHVSSERFLPDSTFLNVSYDFRC